MTFNLTLNISTYFLALKEFGAVLHFVIKYFYFYYYSYLRLGFYYSSLASSVGFDLKLALWQKSSTGIPYFIALCRYCIFYRLKVCGNPVLSKSISAIFPITFSYFMSLCHILVIFAIFQTFSLLSYLLWWSVISDLCYYCKKICWRLRWSLAFFLQ